MNPGRYFMPNMAINPMMIRNGYSVTKGIGLLDRFTQGLRSLNWSKLLNGANKTLNVMNQTIPLVRQARPMISNVKNMLNLAKAFRNETSNTFSHNNDINSMKNDATNKYHDNVISKNKPISDENNSNKPIFFV